MKLMKVLHNDPSIRAKLGFGFITGYTQTVSQDSEGKPMVAVFANVSWELVRSPAVSFHSLQELEWVEIEGVDDEGDLVQNLVLTEEDEEEDEEETQSI